MVTWLEGALSSVLWQAIRAEQWLWKCQKWEGGGQDSHGRLAHGGPKGLDTALMEPRVVLGRRVFPSPKGPFGLLSPDP